LLKWWIYYQKLYLNWLLQMLLLR